MHALILGGAKSGKSRAAEQRAAQWLAGQLHGQPVREAVLLATAHAGDAEMAERIARHQADRALRVPALGCVEVAADLPDAIAAQAAPQRLVLVDCLTLWLTQLALPLHGAPAGRAALQAASAALVQALQQASGPVVLVSNEISLGVLPMSPEARRFVDALGLLHQAVAAACSSVTLMVAGLPLALKGADR